MVTLTIDRFSIRLVFFTRMALINNILKGQVGAESTAGANHSTAPTDIPAMARAKSSGSQKFADCSY